jgi:glycosyltransferase involved in cell wall biosynthesis
MNAQIQLNMLNHSQISGELLSIIIPAFNEDRFLGAVLERIYQTHLTIPFEVLVINDGSTDKTESVALAFQHQVRHQGWKNFRYFFKKNGGKGSAIHWGLCNGNGSLFLIQDADLEYHPSDYVYLLEPFLAPQESQRRLTSWDAMFGSRYIGWHTKYKALKHSKNPLFFIGGQLITLTANILFLQTLSDVCTGYKVFRRELLTRIDFDEPGFCWETQFAARILKNGGRIQECAIQYTPRTVAEGKKIRWWDGIQSLWVLCKERLKWTTLR